MIKEILEIVRDLCKRFRSQHFDKGLKMYYIELDEKIYFNQSN